MSEDRLKEAPPMSELKKCPCCPDGKGKLWAAYDGTYCVQCDKCGLTTLHKFSKQDVVAAWNRRAQLEITGETSDGYHTFNELYHHRAVLFSVICNAHPEMAWKSKLHHDGTMYDGMFIVGIQTPEGQATYHYDIDPYWEMFNVPELPQAPEWDGHTPAQAIERIGKLSAQPENKPADAAPVVRGEWVTTETYSSMYGINLSETTCSACGKRPNIYMLKSDYCPNCGADNRGSGVKE